MPDDVTMHTMEPFLLRVLKDENPTWTGQWSAETFNHFCQLHGTAALVASKYKQGLLPGLTNAEAACLLESLDLCHLFEILHREQVQRILNRMEKEGVPVIVIKGTALAHTVYDNPDLRSRSDTDLLVSEFDRERAEKILINLGFSATPSSSGRLLFHQRCYVLTDKMGQLHQIDLHWRISNRQLFAHLFDWQELISHAYRPPSFPAPGWVLDNVHTILLLILHRVGHLYANALSDHPNKSRDRIIWLYDIYLLAQRLDPADWSMLADLASQKEVSVLVQQTLHSVGESFPFDAPATFLRRLSLGKTSQAARLLLHPSPIQRLRSDFLALDSLRDKLTLVSEILFPGPDYMLERYDKRSYLWLPWLYLIRLVSRASRRKSSS